MPQPVITGTPPILSFGGMPRPNGQGTMAAVNLNDLTSWFWDGLPAGALDGDFYVNVGAHLAWRARGAFIGTDAGKRMLALPMRYRDAVAPLGAALAAINPVASGVQNLTTDNLTAVRCRLSAVRHRELRIKYNPYYYGLTLEFSASTPWWVDLSASTITNQALASGSATNFNQTYAGSIFCEPVWTLTIPNTNAAPIQSFSLSNTMAGETLTISFPGNLAASTAWTLTIDSGLMTVLDQLGHAYDVGGSFPNLYGPAGQSNTLSATLAPASGTATGCTIGASYFNRWEL